MILSIQNYFCYNHPVLQLSPVSPTHRCFVSASKTFMFSKRGKHKCLLMKQTLSLLFLMNPSPIRTFYENRGKYIGLLLGPNPVTILLHITFAIYTSALTTWPSLSLNTCQNLVYGFRLLALDLLSTNIF